MNDRPDNSIIIFHYDISLYGCITYLSQNPLLQSLRTQCTVLKFLKPAKTFYYRINLMYSKLDSIRIDMGQCMFRGHDNELYGHINLSQSQDAVESQTSSI